MSIANELITRGWTQGKFSDADGAVCIRGALQLSGCYDAGYEVVRSLLPPVPNQRALNGREPVAYWNDAPERTFDEVLRVAKEADELLDAATFGEDVSDPEEQIEH